MFVHPIKTSSAGRRRAQGMTEYIMIVALMAVALITIVTLFGNKIKMIFAAAVESTEEGRVIDPKRVKDEKSLKDALGKEEVDPKNWSKAHTLKNFKSSGE